MRTWTLIRTVAILALALRVASGHHPFSPTYDAAKFTTLAGRVAKVQWTNPHVVVALDVASADGSTERWLIEGGAPGGLGRQGWRNDTLREGARVSVSGWLPRDGALRIFGKIFHGREVTFEDGSKRMFGNTAEVEDRWRCSGECPVWIPALGQ